MLDYVANRKYSSFLIPIYAMNETIINAEVVNTGAKKTAVAVNCPMDQLRKLATSLGVPSDQIFDERRNGGLGIIGLTMPNDALVAAGIMKEGEFFRFVVVGVLGTDAQVRITAQTDAGTESDDAIVGYDGDGSYDPLTNSDNAAFEYE